MKYLPGVDYGWVGCDESGHVGVFFTGGEGPIPDESFMEDARQEALFDALMELPTTSSFALLVLLPRPDDYVALAERGLFAFDWSDVHRGKNPINGYELIAQPETPLTLAQLPESLRAPVSVAKLTAARFLEMYIVKLP